MPIGFLSQAHPYPEERHKVFQMAIVSGLVVAAFLMVFQPFGTYEWQHPLKYAFLAGYGLITTLTLLGIGIITRRAFPTYFSENNWTVRREMLLQGLTISAIALFNYLYSMWFTGKWQTGRFHISDFLFMLWATVLIGFFPSALLTSLAQIQNRKKYSTPPQPAPPSPESQQFDENHEIVLESDNGKDQIRLRITDFLFAVAADNYVEVHYRKDQVAQKQLLRASLSRIESKTGQTFLVRCHRSYLVNLHQVVHISGNAQGYRLHLKEVAPTIPVSRSLSEEVLRKLRT
jgi:hypothetical protein